MKRGEIIDYISEKCMCCPGWIIVTGIDTIKVKTISTDENIFFDRVEESGFPISIKFEYTDTEGACSFVDKEVTCIDLLD